jgi:hypothetical protein
MKGKGRKVEVKKKDVNEVQSRSWRRSEDQEGKKRRGIFARLLLLVLDEHKCSCAAIEEEEKTRRIGCK